MLMTVGDNGGQEAIPVIWTFADDGLSARCTTGATLEFLGLDEDGPVYRQVNRLREPRPSDALKPLRFRYAGRELSAEFLVHRQVALAVDTYTGRMPDKRYLLWWLDYGQLKLASIDGKKLAMEDLGRRDFWALNNELYVAFRLWPSQPDELTAEINERGSTYKGHPLQTLVLQGGWLADQWDPWMFQSNGSLSVNPHLINERLMRDLVRQQPVADGPWLRDHKARLRLTHAGNDFYLQFDEKVSYRIASHKRQFHKFTFGFDGQEVGLWIDIHERHGGGTNWSINLRNSCAMAIGIPVNDIYSAASIKKVDAALSQFGAVQDAVLINVVDAIFTWPKSHDTGDRAVTITVSGLRYNNDCITFDHVFARDIRCYSIFSHLNG